MLVKLAIKKVWVKVYVAPFGFIWQVVFIGEPGKTNIVKKQRLFGYCAFVVPQTMVAHYNNNSCRVFSNQVVYYCFNFFVGVLDVRQKVFLFNFQQWAKQNIVCHIFACAVPVNWKMRQKNMGISKLRLAGCC